MTPEAFALLGAQLLLMRRLWLTPRDLAELPDHIVMLLADLLTTEN